MVESNNYEDRLARVERILEELQREHGELKKSTPRRQVVHEGITVPKRGYKRTPISRPTSSTR
jgi:hypothetical protein